MTELYHILKQYGKVKLQESFAKHTTFKIGGQMQYYIQVDTIDTLVSLLQTLDGEGIAYMILGGGSNMLAQDEPYEGVVIHIADKTVIINDHMVSAAAGALTATVSQQTIKAGLTGFDWGVGVPGTVGGAVRGNAGATGGEMKDHVYAVDVYRDGEQYTIPREDCAFGYRDSVFKSNHDVILRVHMTLHPGKDVEGLKKAMEYIAYRNATQPKGYASTGCIFKNVALETLSYTEDWYDIHHIPLEFREKKRIPAGWLVEQIGMKGISVGDAQVSERHGNFIINRGNATAADVSALIQQIKETVYTTYGIVLEEEISFITNTAM